MKKKYIKEDELDRYLNIAAYGLNYYGNNNDGIDKIYEIYEYLKDKKSVKQFGEIKVPNAHLEFLHNALVRRHNIPDYNSDIELFLKSNYIVEELKKEIYIVISDDSCYAQLCELMNSEKSINDFSKEELSLIFDSLLRKYNTTSNVDIKNKCNDIDCILRDYIFILDGEGSIDYIKERYKDELPSIIIEKSGMIASPTYYSGYGIDRSLLGENHLFSIYKKYDKYYPDKTDEFVNMVNSIDYLTPTEFITNYLLFVQNGMNSNFKRRMVNANLDDAPKMLGGFLAVVSAFTQSKNEYKDEYYEWEKAMNAMMQKQIKELFLDKIEQYKKGREKGYKKELKR